MADDELLHRGVVRVHHRNEAGLEPVPERHAFHFFIVVVGHEELSLNSLRLAEELVMIQFKMGIKTAASALGALRFFGRSAGY
jgi:hypothetical protein